MRSDGIDSFGGNGSDGERDGFSNRSASLKAMFHPSPSSEIGLAGHWIEATSAFDGFDPITHLRADTLDNTKNRIRALSGWGKMDWKGWLLRFNANILGSHNDNWLGDTPLNTTSGERLVLGAQLARQAGSHHFIAAIEQENEDFHARDQGYFGFTNQDRSRNLTAFVGEWRTLWSDRFTTDIAIRHDSFSAFGNATSLRASALFKPTEQWTLHAAYGEGIAQPSFYDLFGFFPGSFVGNQNLKPEKSKGWEIGLRWRVNRAAANITAYDNRLQSEIVDVYNPATFLSSAANADGKSRRRGIEIDAYYLFSTTTKLFFTYSWLDAGEQQVAGANLVRELRRPKHSAGALLTGSSGALNWGLSLAYTGKRWDTDFDLYPALRVKLDDYVLGSLKIGYQVTPAIEAYARVENAFGAEYQDVIGYHTSGRTIYAGFRLRLGD
jgi:vitamin B12 transporter